MHDKDECLVGSAVVKNNTGFRVMVHKLALRGRLRWQVEVSVFKGFFMLDLAISGFFVTCRTVCQWYFTDGRETALVVKTLQMMQVLSVVNCSEWNESCIVEVMVLPSSCISRKVGRE